jgi:hypothetical protein
VSGNPVRFLPECKATGVFYWAIEIRVNAAALPARFLNFCENPEKGCGMRLAKATTGCHADRRKARNEPPELSNG